MEAKFYFVYILSSQNHRALYIGVTNNLIRRVSEHRSGLYEGYTKRYRVHKLLYFETFGSFESAMMREKQLKKRSRHNKEQIIQSQNPEYLDLWEFIQDSEY